MDSIGHAPLDAKLFDPPPNASKQEACKRFARAEAEYTTEYFRIRSDYNSGSVVIAGALDDRGKIGQTEIQQSADRKMDEAALKALKEVHIHPAKCDGRAIPSFFRLQIWFSPSMHPDSFQSFR